MSVFVRRGGGGGGGGGDKAEGRTHRRMKGKIRSIIYVLL